MYAIGLVFPLGDFAYVLVIGLGGTTFYVLTNYLLKMPAQDIILQILKEQYLKENHLNKSLNHG
jgi:hypothetical protein